MYVVIAGAGKVGWNLARELIQKDNEVTVIESDPFFAGVLAGVEVVLSREGYALVLQLAANRPAAIERYRRLALDHRIDGAFLTDMARNDARVPMLQELELPAVAVNPAPMASSTSAAV